LYSWHRATLTQGHTHTHACLTYTHGDHTGNLIICPMLWYSNGTDKKYNMMIDNRWIYRYIIMIKTTQFNFSFSLAQELTLSFIVWCPVVSKQTCQSLDCWFFCCWPRSGRGQMFEAKAEAEAKILASRPHWPRGLNISAFLLTFTLPYASAQQLKTILIISLHET